MPRNTALFYPRSDDGVCRLLEAEGDIVLESLSEDLDRLELTWLELDELQDKVIFCHNYLEPRNILVRRWLKHDDSEPQYDLAAIVDWEIAGFYAFAYEYRIKDTPSVHRTYLIPSTPF
ncbi:hypothetical protein BKA56DRAFT_622002 [Ilyonectria sp. MPI-CAGE-AT-0026]|nr:hypothetical protein BKA56DRAFT_622002 [Ilyonectria sp. MPI-CAGE-AT-0026]